MTKPQGWIAGAFAIIAIAATNAQADTESVVHSFEQLPPKGAAPSASVARDAAGNLYGTTVYGGKWGTGVVYKVDPSGHETVLWSFTGGADGGYPIAGVILDEAGNLYGTTENSGSSTVCSNGCGVVYKLDTAGNQTVLHSFTAASDGYYPNPGNLVRDHTGNLYGTTYSGGAGGFGVVYKIDPSGNFSVLYSFTGGNDGSEPYAGVDLDSAGNLYGTTFQGGALRAGVVYKLDPSGHETVLYTFTGGTDGSRPAAGVLRDAAGNLYGTTEIGGALGHGVVYKLAVNGQETVLYSFTGGADGNQPTAGVIRDASGNLYGTTNWGGAFPDICSETGCGVVYKLDASGHQTVLHTFTGGSDGAFADAGLMFDAAGTLFGTASAGGIAGSYCVSGCGVVYKLDSAGQQAAVYRFPDAFDGSIPYGGVLRDATGSLFGTTTEGGSAGAGTVYKVDASGRKKLLYSFLAGADGCSPFAGLTADSAGNLYGTAQQCGAGQIGVVFKLTVGGQYSVLHSFGGPDGALPQSTLAIDSAGNLYGTAWSGGAYGEGAVFKVDPSGQYSILYSFTGGVDGALPTAGVILDAAGNLYGTTSEGGTGFGGVVYKLDPCGQETVLYNFTGAADGGGPWAGVVIDPDGNLYGTTLRGGTAGAGVVYKVSASGQETVLYDFKGGRDGRGLYGGVIRDAAGVLYGTTEFGGTANAGLVYRMDPAGRKDVLYSFTGGADGGYSRAGLTADAAGDLYGTDSGGGHQNVGVVFKLTPQ